ncbi:hypothetical protein D4L85_21385 [Chryseolinea soli]|uniref:Uncharacterized protein n=1 Tax=Chryseolinea soli TaxID=2321403 RepID=A0A385SQ38_9BACT|nr:hypothetical protein D4L85_21385 [Chryseolinea soli]
MKRALRLFFQNFRNPIHICIHSVICDTFFGEQFFYATRIFVHKVQMSFAGYCASIILEDNQKITLIAG